LHEFFVSRASTRFSISSRVSTHTVSSRSRIWDTKYRLGPVPVSSRSRRETETSLDLVRNTKRADNSENTVTRRERRPSPIYLATKILNYAQFAKNLKESIGENFNLKFLGLQVKLQFHKPYDFIDFKKFAIVKNYAFYIYSSA